MAKAKTKTKTKARPPARQPVQAPQKKVERRSSAFYGRIAWVAVVALAALGAFWVAKQQAEGPNEAVAPPPTGLPNTPDYHSLLVDPLDSRNILLGTHVGLYESVDGGRSWNFATLEGDDAMNLARAADQTVWLAGHNVFKKSSDGGATWTDVRPDGLPGLDIHGFAVNPSDPTEIYAAVAGKGLYRSSDGGRTFALVSKGVGPNVMALAVTPDGRVLAGDMQRGLFVSRDGGITWKITVEAPLMGLAVNPDDPGRILAAGNGILLSTDGGRTWNEVQAMEQGAGPVAWAPSDAKTAYVVGFDGQFYRSSDGGASWVVVS